MKFCLIFLLLFIKLWTPTLSARILALYVHDERSHLYSMMPFLERLAKDGHNLTILDTCNDPRPANLNFNATIIHRELPTSPEIEAMIAEAVWIHDPHGAILGLLHKIADDAMGYLIMEASDVFVEIFKREYDLIIVDEIFTIHGMTIAKILRELSGVPYIIFTTSNVGCESNVAEYALGHTPVLDATLGTAPPDGHGDIYDPKNFFIRVYNVLEALGEYFVLYVYIPLIATYAGPPKLTAYPFSTHEIYRNAEMNLRDSLDRLGRIVPHADDFRGIGSHCHISIPELPADLKTFVEDPKSKGLCGTVISTFYRKGTIYIAFGSIVSFDASPLNVLESLFEAFEQFPDYRIIFSLKILKSRKLPVHGSHVKIVPWAPQMAILEHKKTKIFLSHGGLKSFKEALCSKTPIVFMPILAEQGAIARMSMKMGIATTLNKRTLTTEKIVEAFNRILMDPTYEQNMKKYYDLWHDRIVSSLDEGAWYVNKTMQRYERLGKRAASLPNTERSLLFFRRKGINLYSFNHFGFDWIIFVGFVAYLISK